MFHKGMVCDARRRQGNQPFQSLKNSVSNRMHVIELGHGACSSARTGLRSRNPGKNRRSLCRKTGCDLDSDGRALNANRMG